jgi:hypothetical protein
MTRGLITATLVGRSANLLVACGKLDRSDRRDAQQLTTKHQRQRARELTVQRSSSKKRKSGNMLHVLSCLAICGTTTSGRIKVVSLHKMCGSLSAMIAGSRDILLSLRPRRSLIADLTPAEQHDLCSHPIPSTAYLLPATCSSALALRHGSPGRLERAPLRRSATELSHPMLTSGKRSASEELPHGCGGGATIVGRKRHAARKIPRKGSDKHAQPRLSPAERASWDISMPCNYSIKPGKSKQERAIYHGAAFTPAVIDPVCLGGSVGV